MKCFNCGLEGAQTNQFRSCSNGTHIVCVGCDHDGKHGRYECPDAKRWNQYEPKILPMNTRGHDGQDAVLPLAS